MKKLITFLILFNITVTSYSQPLVISEQVSGTTQTLTSVSSNSHGFTDSYAWVCGYGGTVLRTTNSGASWLNVSGNGIPSSTQLINIVSIDMNTAVTAGYVGSNTFVYRTSNAGANWTQVFTENNGFIDAVCFVDIIPSATGFMVGDPVGGRWSLWKTTNSGMNWDSTEMYLPQAGSEAGWNNSLSFDNGKLSFGTNNSKIYYSTNFGTNWVSQQTNGEVNSYSIWFKALSGGPGYTGGSTLLKTTNHGANWTTLPSIGTGNINGITGGPYIVTDNPGDFFLTFYVRSGNSIYSSSNEGAGWNIQYTAPSGNYRFISSNFFGTLFWGVRDNGGITQIYITQTGINTISNEIPDRYSLSQNYPNPFNPSTVIRYSLIENGFVSLKVFDALGKEVTTLVNEVQNRGSYNYQFSTVNYQLPSGIYFYKLEAENFVETKRMILLK